jgi:hypothetical protein
MVEMIGLYAAILTIVSTLERLGERAARILLHENLGRWFSRASAYSWKATSKILHAAFSELFCGSAKIKRISFLRSLTLSSVVVTISMSIVYFSQKEIPIVAMVSSLDIALVFLFVFLGNVVTDYFSLAQSHALIDIVTRTRGWFQFSLIMVADLIMTVLISMFFISFFLTVSVFVFSWVTPADGRIAFKYNPRQAKTAAEFVDSPSWASFDYIIKKSARQDGALRRAQALTPGGYEVFLDSIIKERGGVSVGGIAYFAIGQEGPLNEPHRNIFRKTVGYSPEEPAGCKMSLERLFRIAYLSKEIDVQVPTQRELTSYCKDILSGKTVEFSYPIRVQPNISFSEMWSYNFDVLFEGFRALYGSFLKFDYWFQLRTFFSKDNSITKQAVVDELLGGLDSTIETEFDTQMWDKFSLNSGLREFEAVRTRVLNERYGNIVPTDNVYLRPFLISTLIPTIILWSLLLGVMIVRPFISQAENLQSKCRMVNDFPLTKMAAIGSLPIIIGFALLQ